VNETGALVALAMNAEICVVPGVSPATLTWPLATPNVLNGVSFTTDGCEADHENGPTVDEMSIVGCPVASSAKAIAS
jgi:hypothetical protein